MKIEKPFLYVLFGMIGGGLFGFITFYSLDSSKGWNPYGWWFPATFIITIVGGIAGLFIHGYRKKKKDLRLEL